MNDLFLSYSQKDWKKAKHMVAALEQSGYTVWWDRTITAGKVFDEVTEKALASAKCVLVLWSEHSVRSNWVKAEADEGLKRGVLVPVSIDSVNIPLQFRRIQTVDLSNWNGGASHPGFQEMLWAIAGQVNPEPETDSTTGVPSANHEGTEALSEPSDSARTSTTRHFLLRYLLLPVTVGLFIVMAKFSIDYFSEPKQGDLQIFSSADSVAVYLNDSTLGYARAGEPLRRQWPKGRYLLRGEKAGFTPFSETVNIIAGEMNSFEMTLTPEEEQPPNETPSLRADTAPVKTYSVIVTVPDAFENAKIFVDGKWLGNASDTIQVPEGSRLFRVEYENYVYETKLQVRAENTLLNITQDEFKPKDVAGAGR